MTPSDLRKVFDTTTAEIERLMFLKNGEYAASNDSLANFREAARRTGMTTAQVLLVYLDKHYSAVCNFIKDEAAGVHRTRTEPIEGRVHDIMNYLILYKAMLSENRAMYSAVNSDEGPRLVWDASDEE